jgi:hypothetical protein
LSGGHFTGNYGLEDHGVKGGAKGKGKKKIRSQRSSLFLYSVPRRN